MMRFPRLSHANQQRLKELLWWGSFLLVAFAMRSSLASTYLIPSESMEPTILPGDRLIANQTAYKVRVPFSELALTKTKMPSRGEIVIFPSPTDPINLIKRVVAIGGDTIAVRKGRIWRNGRPLPLKSVATPKLPPQWRRYIETNGKARYTVQWDDAHPSLRDMPPTKIPAGHFFVMGDNRDYSGDSRIFGAVSKHKLHAQAIRHFYSLGQGRLRWGRLFSPLR